jgi:hypothetical protein
LAQFPRAQFVGIAAYEAAGGIVMRDLFEHDGGGWLKDPALLDRLVSEKLQTEAETLRAEGWKRITIAPDLPGDLGRPNEAVTDAELGEPSSHTENNAGLKCTWPVTVDRDYTKSANQQALAQLGKAGFRLAALLKAIFETQ